MFTWSRLRFSFQVQLLCCATLIKLADAIYPPQICCVWLDYNTLTYVDTNS